MALLSPPEAGKAHKTFYRILVLVAISFVKREHERDERNERKM